MTEVVPPSALSLTAAQVKEIQKFSKDKVARMEALLGEVKAQLTPDGSTAVLVLLSKLPPKMDEQAPLLVNMVTDGRIASGKQMEEAVKYVKGLKANPLDQAALEVAAGVGVTVTRGQLVDSMNAAVKLHSAELDERRYLFPAKRILGTLLKSFPDMKWADSKDLQPVLAECVAAYLGPRTAEDDAAAAAPKPKANAKKGKEKAAAARAAESAAGAGAGEEPESTAFVGREMASSINSERLLAEHKAVVGTKVRTRFPPEPNGYLHIGHTKSMCLNFETAFKQLGVAPENQDVTFRYDDTNPEAESHEYIESQAENVHWMGWRPTRTTFSSQYFDQLYEFAKELIRRGKAYVCHQSQEEIKTSREASMAGTGTPESPFRERSVEENLREFENMRLGLYAKGKATLRMKIDMHSPNPCMWDPIAYRIKYHPHPRTGDKWCIYPSYDFTHCLVDSLEHIDYSLCTLEFEIRRDSYYWLLEALDLWRPMVWEFSRLNITDTPLSKRKLLKFVQDGIVQGWDDPRMPTINGLRRRGYPAEALNDFCRAVGVTRANNVVMLSRLETTVRSNLNETSTRGFAVLNPLKVTLTNFGDDVREVQAYDFPMDPSRGSHAIELGKVVYIDREDFRLEDSKSYYGLAPNKVVGLKYGGFMKCTHVHTDAAGAVAELSAEFMDESPTKVKGHLHWVSSAAGAAPAMATVRLYDTLCKQVGAELELRERSEWTVEALVDRSVAAAAATPGTRLQFERVGFFVVDVDSTAEHPVFTRTVTLKASSEKRRGV